MAISALFLIMLIQAIGANNMSHNKPKWSIPRRDYDTDVVIAEQELYAAGMLDAENGLGPIARAQFEFDWMFEAYNAGRTDRDA